uniref:Uncharacterized protein n=1 Tax=Rhizophora mucronata TaxID=61149 RepID=A0A2P2IJI8_RHIMU
MQLMIVPPTSSSYVQRTRNREVTQRALQVTKEVIKTNTNSCFPGYSGATILTSFLTPRQKYVP